MNSDDFAQLLLDTLRETTRARRIQGIKLYFQLPTLLFLGCSHCLGVEIAKLKVGVFRLFL